MKLEELLPEHPEFTLSSTGKCYQLRLINLTDLVYFKTRFGDPSAIQKIFEKMEFDKLIQIVYRLLVDKSDFKSSVEKVIDDNGDELEVKVTGPEKLMSAITSVKEGVALMGAVMKCVTMSNPDIADLVKDGVKDLEKKTQELLKPTLTSTLDSSSTSSQASMDTPLNNLAI